MNLQYRIDLLADLGKNILQNDAGWAAATEKAGYENGWFTPEFIQLSASAIARQFLDRNNLLQWAARYQLPDRPFAVKNVGIVMAGNIPLVGFHDFLCVFLAGHKATIKTSSKDNVLIRHIAGWLAEREPGTAAFIQFADMLKGCDAYITTGSNNSSRYFEYYFAKYPHIIRRNRTSAALLTGEESLAELDLLADDVFLYFGLGCRNVTKLYVPADYDFVPLLAAFKKYNYLADHHKYKNNYDYNLALLILNNKGYMSTESILLAENPALFSPISMLHYEYYSDKATVENSLHQHPDLQCLVGNGHIPFGSAQSPALTDYADGVDTLQFLTQR
jgi:hypothetical protein